MCDHAVTECRLELVAEFPLTTLNDVLRFNRIMCNIAEHVHSVAAALTHVDDTISSILSQVRGLFDSTTIPTKSDKSTYGSRSRTGGDGSGKGGGSRLPQDSDQGRSHGVSNMRVLKVRHPHHATIASTRHELRVMTPHVRSDLQASHRVYSASLNNHTIVVKVQRRDRSDHEATVLERMSDPECHTVKKVWQYSHDTEDDVSALVLEYVPYPWDHRLEGLDEAVKRAAQLIRVQ